MTKRKTTPTKPPTKPVAPRGKKPVEKDHVDVPATGDLPQIAGTQEKAPEKLIADPDTIRQALDDLGIDRPYYIARFVGSRLELVLYGGDVVTWPPETGRKKP